MLKRLQANTLCIREMATQNPFYVLIFSKTSGYRHDSIPAGIASLQQLAGQTSRFTVTASEDASAFTPDSLSKYRVIVLLQTIGNIFSQDQLDALKHFVRAGGGVVAIHGAAAGIANDAWYGKLIGAHFAQHPPHERGTVLVEEANQDHFIMNCCGGRKGWMDEWYNFHSHPRENGNLNILLRGDPRSFEGGKHGDDHPLGWCQEFEGGRVFFTALGHFEDAYRDGWFVGQIGRGILWAARQEDMS
ncbi:secreted glycosyl hydrolase [Karstenula rhodostoma CBS 690.94]|uniref:Secreted glycosyl hydrolase n=1 Tax=Karstenula rhodostoma CBS 690.94 TaxID=1392251 RepID=A0A9P4UC01_9PLEO|nr:secreted glycosyl hydrolase [Karstenula rhodostoma CBS 690.94]